MKSPVVGLMLLCSKLFIVSGSPSNKICGGDPNTIHGMESPVRHMLLCSQLFCLWLPILYHAGGRLAKYNDWNVKSGGVDASLQQTLFIVSATQLITMC